MPSPRLPRVRHTHAAVFSHSSEVRPLRTTRTQCKVKRQYSEQTEPSLASNLFVTLPSAAGDVYTADGATGTGASATALRAPLRAVDALWGHCYTTPHCDNAGESLGVDDTEAATVIACAVIQYQAPSAGGAGDMVSAGKPGTLRHPRISGRGHDMGGGCPPQGCWLGLGGQGTPGSLRPHYTREKCYGPAR
jgi:hypothetical protein